MTTLEKQVAMKRLMNSIELNGGKITVTRDKKNIVIAVDASNYGEAMKFVFDPEVDATIQQVIGELEAYLFRMKRVINSEAVMNSWMRAIGNN